MDTIKSPRASTAAAPTNHTDEGSSYITVRNNWTPSEKFLKNANGPGNTWENNGPQVSDSIRAQAGTKLYTHNTYDKKEK